MKKPKQKHPIKKTNKWLLPAILAAVLVLAVGISIIIATQMKGETIPEFNAENALAQTHTIAAFHNRYPEHQDYEKSKQFLLTELKNYTDYVTENQFSFVDTIAGDTLQLTNIVASFYPNNPQRIMFSAHYDTPKSSVLDSTKIGDFLAATDNSSGIGLLLEMSRLMNLQEPIFGVDIVFFDGTTSLDYGDSKNLFVGAKKFLNSMPDYKPAYALNFNHIGAQGLTIYPDDFSNQFASDIIENIWGLANELKIKSFKKGKKVTVADNHLILVKNRLKTVDIFDYNWKENRGKNYDPASFNAVGEVLINHIY